ncbi:GNAT family N-acetyltransferase [Streptomyces sp. 7R007]
MGTTTEIVLRDLRGTVVGHLRFRACEACRTGRIMDVWIRDSRQRQGLGRGLVHTLLGRYPGHRWSTTLQTGAGRSFFSALTDETSVPFPQGGPLCEHLAGRLTRAWHRAMGWRTVSGHAKDPC